MSATNPGHSPKIDFSKLTPLQAFESDDPGDRVLIPEMAAAGVRWLEDHDWCRRVLETYVGDVSIGGIVVVLL